MIRTGHVGAKSPRHSPREQYREVIVLYPRRPHHDRSSIAVVWEGRFRYSDLKEAARRASLWILCVVEQARLRYRVASARQLRREIVRIERTGRGWREG